MLAPNSVENRYWQNNQGQLFNPRGGVAPLRHDLALAQYLEKQRANGRDAAVEPGTTLVVPMLQRLLNRVSSVASMHMPSRRSRFD
jgi:hypothetical protein